MDKELTINKQTFTIENGNLVIDPYYGPLISFDKDEVSYINSRLFEMLELDELDGDFLEMWDKDGTSSLTVEKIGASWFLNDRKVTRSDIFKLQLFLEKE